LLPARAQNLDKPVSNIDEEVTAFAYAPNGNVVFPFAACSRPKIRSPARRHLA
jgi:hypothetical protein